MIRRIAGSVLKAAGSAHALMRPKAGAAASAHVGLYAAMVTVEAADPREDAAEKLRRLHAVTDATLSRLDSDDFLDELLDRARDLLDVDTAAVLFLDPTEQTLLATATHGIEKAAQLPARMPVEDSFVSQVMARRQPLQTDRTGSTGKIHPILTERGISSLAAAPMIAAGQAAIGAVRVGTLAPRRFTDDDIELLQLIAERIALVTEAHRARLDRTTTIALQRSLLPARPPTVPGLDVAARYIPGSQTGVGGDWYDLFALPSGYVGVTIGDVTGNGLRAAVVMGRIRSALRAYAIDSENPAEVLTRLDRKIQMFEPGAMATVIYAVIDPSHENLTLSIAGHLPPVLAVPDQPTQLLKVTVDLPLGAYPDTSRHASTVALPAGSTLFFYTDGLIERRDRLLTDGLEMLRARIKPLPADALCSSITTTFLEEATTDDVAVLALHRTGLAVMTALSPSAGRPAL